jgi:hypothetical protein
MRSGGVITDGAAALLPGDDEADHADKQRGEED